MEVYGTLVIRLGFDTAAEYGRRGKEVRLHTIHGTLGEVKPKYRAWLDHNPQLAKMVNAHFEARMAVHKDDL